MQFVSTFCSVDTIAMIYLQQHSYTNSAIDRPTRRTDFVSTVLIFRPRTECTEKVLIFEKCTDFLILEEKCHFYDKNHIKTTNKLQNNKEIIVGPSLLVLFPTVCVFTTLMF